jgi:phosphate transport system substrate-binding protein
MAVLVRGLITAVGLASAALALSAEEVRITGTGSAVGTMRLVGEAFAKSDRQSSVTVLPAIGSGGAVRAVTAGALDIALTSRPLTPEERERGLVELEYARTPLVFATWARNPMDNVSLTDLAELYGGKRLSWPDRTPVRPVLRPASDIDSKLVKALSGPLADAVAAAEQRPGMTFADTDSDAASAIERLPGSLGTIALAQIISERRSVKVLRLRGVQPGVRTLASGEYGLEKKLFLVTGARPSAATRGFIRYLRSESGKRILAQNGHLVTPAR